MNRLRIPPQGITLLLVITLLGAGFPSLAVHAQGITNNNPESTDSANATRKIFLSLIYQSQATTPPGQTDPPAPTSKDNYYVDANAGSDSNSGVSESAPWKSLSKVNATRFPPGAVVHFKRGATWTGELRISSSGSATAPIFFVAYGSGARPTFRNPGSPSNMTRAIYLDASWVVLEGLLVRDAQDAGVFITANANNTIVRDLEATATGFGVSIRGQHNLVTGSYMHDLTMIRNTPGGDDDYGATAVALYNSYNEVAFNRFIRCKAASYDYGSDGGGVELYGNITGSTIHHNWVTGTDGFIEVGGGSARDTIVAYNVAINNGVFTYLHLSGNFAAAVSNFRVENNTIVETASSKMGWMVLGFGGTPASGAFVLRNNIIYADYFNAVSQTAAITHDHNLFFLGRGTQLGFSLGSAEKIADPLFVNLAGQDLHLQSGSPAINAGVSLGYKTDFDGHAVPSGSAPDLGAYER